MYRLYADSRTEHWKILKTHTNLDVIKKEADKLTSKEYYSYIIKETINNTDNVVEQKSLFDECKVEYTDNVKTDFEVKTTTFKPSRMKQKEELRKEIERYL